MRVLKDMFESVLEMGPMSQVRFAGCKVVAEEWRCQSIRVMAERGRQSENVGWAGRR